MNKQTNINYQKCNMLYNDYNKKTVSLDNAVQEFSLA